MKSLIFLLTKRIFFGLVVTGMVVVLVATMGVLPVLADDDDSFTITSNGHPYNGIANPDPENCGGCPKLSWK